MKSIMLPLAMGALALAGLGGCASQGDQNVVALQEQLSESQEKSQALQTRVGTLESSLSEKDRLLQQASARSAQGAGEPELPPNAKAGECYARVYIPPRYEENSERVLVREASYRIQVSPPTYRNVPKRVLVEPESQRIEVIPAKYGWKSEELMVRPSTERFVTDPPVYETVTKRILVRPSYTTWKKGRGPIEKLDEATGEIMCLVTVPAEYRTVSQRVLKRPAATRKIVVPAQFKTVRKRVVIEPAKTRSVTIPAKYRTELIAELAKDAQEKRIPIDPVYKTVTKSKQVSEGRVAWRPILCETNTTPGVVQRLQTALLASGHNPGEIDGVIGPDTMAAVTTYQKSKGFASGQLTIETLKSLGVEL